VVSKALKEIRIEVAEEQEVTDAKVPVETKVSRSDQPATPVGLVDKGSIQDQSDRPVAPVRPINEASVQTGA
jgi:hypothetical protein